MSQKKKEEYKAGLYGDEVREKLLEFAEQGYDSIPEDEKDAWLSRFKFWGVRPPFGPGGLFHDAADQL